MPKQVDFGKQRRRVLSNARLPPDVRVALIEFKNLIHRGGPLTEFGNREEGLPRAAAGQTYYEYQVGQAHEGDEQPRGKRRLVALLDPGRNVLKMYFSDAHYAVGEWAELQYP